MMRRGNFVAHRPTRSPADLRLDWIAAVDLACRLADMVAGASDDQRPAHEGFGQGLTRLTVLLRDLKAENFSAGFSSAQACAAAFLNLARSFANPALAPEARTACAAFLREGSLCLDRLLVRLRTHESQAWRGQTGERED